MTADLRDTVLTVRPFSAQRDGDEIVIGNPSNGVFLAVSPETAWFLEELALGKTIGQVADLYEEAYGEVPDFEDFLNILQAKGMISKAGEEQAQIESKLAPARPARYHFANFPLPVARLLFSKTAIFTFLAAIAFALLAVMVHPEVRPSRQDLFFPDRRALTLLILAVLDIGMLFVHEMAHLVAARAEGVNSRLGVSHRLWNVVAETDLTGLWSLPAKKRYLPIMAGLLIDGVSWALVVFVILAQNEHVLSLPPFALRLFRALSFWYLVRIAWEFFLYVRTDIYFVTATFFNCKNLLVDAENFLRNRFAALLRFKPVDQSAIPLAEMKVVRAYSLLWILGRIWAFTTLVFVTYPLATAYIVNLRRVFLNGYRANPGDFVDALSAAVIFLTPLTAGLFLWIRGLLGKKRTN